VRLSMSGDLKEGVMTGLQCALSSFEHRPLHLRANDLGAR